MKIPCTYCKFTFIRKNRTYFYILSLIFANLILIVLINRTLEPLHDKTNKVAYAPNEYSDQPGHPPSLIRETSPLCAQWVAKDPRFLHADSENSDQTGDAQADLSLRWAHMPFCWFCHEAAHFSRNFLKKIFCRCE